MPERQGWNGFKHILMKATTEESCLIFFQMLLCLCALRVQSTAKQLSNVALHHMIVNYISCIFQFCTKSGKTLSIESKSVSQINTGLVSRFPSIAVLVYIYLEVIFLSIAVQLQ